MKQRRSSLCPRPHLTIIPAAIPERIKRWRALLALETKRLKIRRALDPAQPDKSPNSSGLLSRPPRDPRKKDTPLASQINITAKRCDQECRVIVILQF